MASATNIPAGKRLDPEAAIVYGSRDNITVPGADQTDPAVAATGTLATIAAARVTDRPGPFAPDQADYVPKGSERSAP